MTRIKKETANVWEHTNDNKKVLLHENARGVLPAPYPVHAVSCLGVEGHRGGGTPVLVLAGGTPVLGLVWGIKCPKFW